MNKYFLFIGTKIVGANDADWAKDGLEEPFTGRWVDAGNLVMSKYLPGNGAGWDFLMNTAVSLWLLLSQSIAFYLWVRTGTPLAFQDAQRKFWFRRSPELAALDALTERISLRRDFILSPSPYLTVGYLAAIAGIARRVPVEWTLFGLLTILMPLSTGRYAGIARYGLLALPAFWALALLGGRFSRLWRVYLVLGPALGAFEVVWWLPGHTP